MGDNLAEVPGILLGEFDLVAGLDIRDTVYALGLDPTAWRLVDLNPPRKSRQINRRGRKLRITPELIITSSTGLGRPLGDPKKVAGNLARGERSKLCRRLASDVKALYALYRYGVLHAFVRLRWGFLDETFAVEWAVPVLDSFRPPGSILCLQSNNDFCYFLGQRRPASTILSPGPGPPAKSCRPAPQRRH